MSFVSLAALLSPAVATRLEVLANALIQGRRARVDNQILEMTRHSYSFFCMEFSEIALHPIHALSAFFYPIFPHGPVSQFKPSGEPLMIQEG